MFLSEDVPLEDVLLVLVLPRIFGGDGRAEDAVEELLRVRDQVIELVGAVHQRYDQSLDVHVLLQVQDELLQAALGQG